MKALRIPSLRRLRKNPDGLGAFVILAAAGTGIYLATRKKKKAVRVLEPSGPPREEPVDEAVIETGPWGECQWWLRTKDGRFGYWTLWKSGSGGTSDDEFETIHQARRALFDRLTTIENETGAC